MDLGKYIDEKITSLRKVHVDYQEAMEKITKHYSSEWVTMRNTPIHISPEAVAANEGIGREIAGKLIEERDAEIDKIIKEAEDTLAAEKKKAIQEYAAAEPVPTDEQLRRVDQLRSEYTVGGIFTMTKFKDEMDFHVENETVYAYPYYLLARGQLTDSLDDQERLNRIYNTLFPQITEKAAALKSVEEWIKVFRTQVILFRFSFEGDTMGQLDKIRLKLELQDMGTANQLAQ